MQLVRQGLRPLVLDAAPEPGGRARGLEHDLGGTRVRVDNGQHLLLGAYRDTLQVMATVGVSAGRHLQRMPFELRYPDGWRLAAARAPAPWHLALGLAQASGMPWHQRLSVARWSLRQRRAGWRTAGDLPAARLFDGEPPELTRRIWRPLCLAALNVDPAQASARMLLRVLGDSLGARSGASDLLLPRTDLSRLFPAAAVAWLRAHGAEVRLHTPVLRVLAGTPPGSHGSAGPLRLALRDCALDAGWIVLALPPDRCAALLQGLPAAQASVACLRAVASAPICTAYLRYDARTRLPAPMLALLDDPSRGHYGQWVFDRGATDPSLAGVLSVVVSGTGPHMDLPRARLGARLAAQLSECLGLPAPHATFTVMEKRATVLPVPELRRPGAVLSLAGVILAGDAADSPYPSTIEGSVRSGLQAARAVAAAGLPSSS